jgi:hypothetical protein
VECVVFCSVMFCSSVPFDTTSFLLRLALRSLIPSFSVAHLTHSTLFAHFFPLPFSTSPSPSPLAQRCCGCAYVPPVLVLVPSVALPLPRILTHNAHRTEQGERCRQQCILFCNADVTNCFLCIQYLRRRIHPPPSSPSHAPFLSPHSLSSPALTPSRLPSPHARTSTCQMPSKSHVLPLPRCSPTPSWRKRKKVKCPLLI